MTIIITGKGKAIRRDQVVFTDEKELQQFIDAHPECIPLYETDEDRKLQIIVREFQVSSGRVDAIGVDQYGEIYIIETKLYKNPDKRRVLAQVLDYGASMASDYTDFNKFAEEFKSQTSNDVIDKIISKFTESDELVENFRKNILENRFKFIILMDKLDDGLKILIKFINQHSDFKIYAVELKQYKYDKNVTITIPKLFGAEISPINNSRKRIEGNEEMFFDQAKKLKQQQLETVKKLYDFTKKEGRISWGTGEKTSSFSAHFEKIHKNAIYFVRSDGKLTFQLSRLNTGKNEKRSDELRIKLSEIKNLDIQQGKNAHIKIDKLVDSVEDIISCLKSVLYD